jgi:iron complex outermembrane recepter protein
MTLRIVSPLRRVGTLTRVALTSCLPFVIAFAAHAQTGTITGRILNPVSGEYVRNAEIRVQGTDLLAVSEDAGTYELARVPAGQAKLVVTFTGYTTVTATVDVPAGGTVTRDFELRSSEVSALKNESAVKLDAYVVSSEREGNAKAIMQQRNSMNIGNIVASDIFGDVAQGNVGEFLKYLPGVDLDYVEADARTPSLHGLPPQYVGVTLDGNSMASADAGIQYNGTDNVAAGEGSRSFSFEQVSLNSVESIEVNYSPSADMDATSTAGNINLRTKRAFDRRGRQVFVQASFGANSEDFTFKKTQGPDDYRNYKITPNAVFEYSDVFLNKRLGVIINVSESNAYDQQRLSSYSYNTTTSATDARPFVLSGVSFKGGPKFTERSSTTISVDYKLTPRLAIGLNILGNYYKNSINNRTFGVTFSNPRITATSAGSTLTGYTGAATMSTSSTFLRKRTSGLTLTPSFEYKWRNIRVDGALRYSRSANSYADALPHGTARDISNFSQPSGISVNASRSSIDDTDWNIIETAGPSWSDLTNYKSSATQYLRVSDDGRYARKEIYTGTVNAQITMPWTLPTVFKVGAKENEEYNLTENRQPYNNYEWRGGGTGNSLAIFPSSTPFDMGHGINLVSTTGGAPAFASRGAFGRYYADHTGEFVNVASVSNYESAYYLNHRATKEITDALFIQGQTRVFKRLELRAGLRWENDRRKISQFVPLLNSQVYAASPTLYGVTKTTTTTNGVTTTTYSNPTNIAGMDYKYQTIGTRPRYGGRGAYFPSASVKYSFTPNLQAQVGWGRSITRPSFNDLGGIFTFNEVNQTATIPNPTVTSQMSDSYNGKIAYYFEPVGTFAISAWDIVSKNALTNITVPYYSVADIINDPTLADYEFTTKINSPGITRSKGMSYEYSQQLSFLPKPFNTLGVSASYTRNYVQNNLNQPWKPGVSPHAITGGVHYSYRRFMGILNGKWTDNTPYSTTRDRYRKHRIMMDLTAVYSLTKTLSLSISGRNITDEPDFVYDDPGKTGSHDHLNKIEYYGTSWNAAIRARF